jgi:metal-responsive CopG/Arc/MetJ family transcriptional regulator
MKAKTSITLSADLLQAIDELASPGVSRSAFIERVLRAFLADRRRRARDARDLRAINRHAQSLKAEAADVLTYQAEWLEE